MPLPPEFSLNQTDPEIAARVMAAAVAGDRDAQFSAGLIYARGLGVGIDLVQAYYWLTQALEQGDADAERLRQHVALQMSDPEFEQACRLVRQAASAGACAPGVVH
jgi:localization factor PodJL